MICLTPSQPSGPRGIRGLFKDHRWMNIWKTGAVSAVIFPGTSIQSAWHTVGSQQKTCCRKTGRKGQRKWIHWSQYFRYLFYELTSNYCLRYWKLLPSFRFFSILQGWVEINSINKETPPTHSSSSLNQGNHETSCLLRVLFISEVLPPNLLVKQNRDW